MVRQFYAGRKADRMRYIRRLSLICPVLAYASGCSISLFNTTHEHKEPKEPTLAIEHRVEVLEQRMNAVEQTAPAVGPADAAASGLTIPASGEEPAHFEESAPAGSQHHKKGSRSKRQKPADESASSGIQESKTSIDADSQMDALAS